MKAIEACWWVIGAETKRPAVAVDLHDSTGNLVGETWCMSLDSIEQAEQAALIHAAEHGIGALDVSFDPDTTQFYRRD